MTTAQQIAAFLRTYSESMVRAQTRAPCSSSVRPMRRRFSPCRRLFCTTGEISPMSQPEFRHRQCHPACCATLISNDEATSLRPFETFQKASEYQIRDILCSSLVVGMCKEQLNGRRPEAYWSTNLGTAGRRANQK